jgi:hypothetical protein
MTKTQSDFHIQEMRAVTIIERVTSAVEKWSKNQEKIGNKPLSVEKKERAVALANELLTLHKLKMDPLFINVVIESTCLNNDNMQPLADLPLDPTIDSEDDDEDE